MGHYRQGALARTRTLRTNQTDAEHRLWYILRNRQLGGHKFVRQLPVGPFIADFACRERDLIIELDGGQHAGSLADVRRTEVLAAHGYRVLRFWNDEVFNNLDGVVQVIEMHLAKAPSPGLRFAKPDLSPEGRGNAGALRRVIGPLGPRGDQQ